MGFDNDWQARNENSTNSRRSPARAVKENPISLQKGLSHMAGSKVQANVEPPGRANGKRSNVSQNLRLGSIAEDSTYRSKAKSRVSTWDPLHPVVKYNNRKDVLKKYQYYRGLIFNAALHTEDATPTRPIADREARSMSAHGPVFTKPRFMIVVSLHETTYMAIPLYTHEQRGLRGREHYEHEFVSVRDGRIPAVDFKAQSRFKPIVTDGTGPKINLLSTAHFANPVSRTYELPISICGRLTDESADRLLTMFKEELCKGLGLGKK